jgi:hypothetical protein
MKRSYGTVEVSTDDPLGEADHMDVIAEIFMEHMMGELRHHNEIVVSIQNEQGNIILYTIKVILRVLH